MWQVLFVLLLTTLVSCSDTGWQFWGNDQLADTCVDVQIHRSLNPCWEIFRNGSNDQRISVPRNTIQTRHNPHALNLFDEAYPPPHPSWASRMSSEHATVIQFLISAIRNLNQTQMDSNPNFLHFMCFLVYPFHCKTNQIRDKEPIYPCQSVCFDVLEPYRRFSNYCRDLSRGESHGEDFCLEEMNFRRERSYTISATTESSVGVPKLAISATTESSVGVPNLLIDRSAVIKSMQSCVAIIAAIFSAVSLHSCFVNVHELCRTYTGEKAAMMWIVKRLIAICLLCCYLDLFSNVRDLCVLYSPGVCDEQATNLEHLTILSVIALCAMRTLWYLLLLSVLFGTPSSLTVSVELKMLLVRQWHLIFFIVGYGLLLYPFALIIEGMLKKQRPQQERVLKGLMVHIGSHLLGCGLFIVCHGALPSFKRNDADLIESGEELTKAEDNTNIFDSGISDMELTGIVAPIAHHKTIAEDGKMEADTSQELPNDYQNLRRACNNRGPASATRGNTCNTRRTVAKRQCTTAGNPTAGNPTAGNPQYDSSLYNKCNTASRNAKEYYHILKQADCLEMSSCSHQAQCGRSLSSICSFGNNEEVIQEGGATDLRRETMADVRLVPVAVDNIDEMSILSQTTFMHRNISAEPYLRSQCMVGASKRVPSRQHPMPAGVRSKGSSSSSATFSFDLPKLQPPNNSAVTESMARASLNATSTSIAPRTSASFPEVYSPLPTLTNADETDEERVDSQPLTFHAQTTREVLGNGEVKPPTPRTKLDARFFNSKDGIFHLLRWSQVAGSIFLLTAFFKCICMLMLLCVEMGDVRLELSLVIVVVLLHNIPFLFMGVTVVAVGCCQLKLAPSKRSRASNALTL